MSKKIQFCIFVILDSEEFKIHTVVTLTTNVVEHQT